MLNYRRGFSSSHSLPPPPPPSSSSLSFFLLPAVVASATLPNAVPFSSLRAPSRNQQETRWISSSIMKDPEGCDSLLSRRMLLRRGRHTAPSVASNAFNVSHHLMYPQWKVNWKRDILAKDLDTVEEHQLQYQLQEHEEKEKEQQLQEGEREADKAEGASSLDLREQVKKYIHSMSVPHLKILFNEYDVTLNVEEEEDELSCWKLITLFSNEGQPTEALKILQKHSTIQHSKSPLASSAYSSLLSTLIKHESPLSDIDHIYTLFTLHHQPTNQQLIKLIKLHAKHQNEDRLNQLLDQFRTFKYRLPPAHCMDILNSLVNQGRYDLCYRTFNRIISPPPLTTNLNIIFFNQLMNLFGSHKMINEALQIYSTMKSLKISPDDFTLSIVMKFLNHAHRFSSMKAYFNEIVTLGGLSPNAVAWNSLLHGYVAGNMKYKQVRHLFKEIKSRHLASSFTYGKMIEYFSNTNQPIKGKIYWEEFKRSQLPLSEPLLCQMISFCSKYNEMKLLVNVFEYVLDMEKLKSTLHATTTNSSSPPPTSSESTSTPITSTSSSSTSSRPEDTSTSSPTSSTSISSTSSSSSPSTPAYFKVIGSFFMDMRMMASLIAIISSRCASFILDRIFTNYFPVILKHLAMYYRNPITPSMTRLNPSSLKQMNIQLKVTDDDSDQSSSETDNHFEFLVFKILQNFVFKGKHDMVEKLFNFFNTIGYTPSVNTYFTIAKYCLVKKRFPAAFASLDRLRTIGPITDRIYNTYLASLSSSFQMDKLTSILQEMLRQDMFPCLEVCELLLRVYAEVNDARSFRSLLVGMRQRKMAMTAAMRRKRESRLRRLGKWNFLKLLETLALPPIALPTTTPPFPTSTVAPSRTTIPSTVPLSRVQSG